MTDTTLRFRPGGDVRAVGEGDARELEVLACPFGGPDDLDKLGEYLSARTDFGDIEVGDKRPAFYFHGFSPNIVNGKATPVAHPAPIGKGTVSRIDARGLWMTVKLKAGALADRVWESAKAGTCRASTGAVNFLTRDVVNKEVLHWVIGEVSLLDEALGRHPISDKAIAMPLRASFEALDLDWPEAWGQAEPEVDVVSNPPIRATGETNMSTEIELAVKAALDAKDAEAAKAVATEAALRTKIEGELKAKPEYRAQFSIARATAGVKLTAKEVEQGITLEDKKENHEYIYKLRTCDPSVMAPVSAMRAGPFTETDAVEALPLVPAVTLGKIHEKRDAVSWAREAGIEVYTLDKGLILNVPCETTKMVTLAPIAGEAVFTENVPALVTVPATVVKHGGFIDIEQETLEDQDLFQSFMVRAIGRAYGLAENVDVAALVATGTGVENAGAGAMTDAEVLAWFYALDPEYRQGGAFFMGDDLLAYLRAKLIATPRAYGELGFSQPLGVGQRETFLGKPVFTDANLTAIGWATAADALEYANFCNMGEAFALVERRGLRIFVDPYTQALNEIVRYYFSGRWTMVKTNADATALVSAHHA